MDYGFELNQLFKDKQKFKKALDIVFNYILENDYPEDFSKWWTDKDFILWFTNLKCDELYYDKTIKGKIVEISCCCLCNKWEVGKYRCSCGNVRVKWEIWGNIVDGLFRVAVSC